MFKMELSLEKDNFVKLSYILLDVVARHLREYFVKLWDKKYPAEKWHDDVAKRNLKLQTLLAAGNEKLNIYSKKILNGDEKEWDITTLLRASVDSRLQLIEGSRPPAQRTTPLRESEEIEVIRGIRNTDYGHISSMSCPLAKFIEIMTKMKSTAKNLFGQDAELEIYKIEMSPVTPAMREHVNELLMDVEEVKEKVHIVELEVATSDARIGQSKLQLYKEKDIDELKEMYKIQYQKHSINKVDKNGRIVMKAVMVQDFAVKLKISEIRPAPPTFRDETRQHFEHLKDMAGKYIELNELLNHDDRVVLVIGVPGVGKTVLTKQLAFLWANNKIYTQFKLCIMMECRDINHFAASEGAALKKHELFSEYLKTKFGYELRGGVSTLLIIDGIDELDGFHSNDSVIWQLLDVRHAKYTKARIILTGRPHVEGKLERKGKDIGGLHRCEIQGLSDDQIQDYVKKFASCNDDFEKIEKAIHSSKEHVKIVSIPAFLNSMCCVILLSDVQTVKNTAELYVWILYFLLKEHGEKDGSSRKRCSAIFMEYSSELGILSEICHELLSKNKIIFEGDVKSRLLKCGKGKEFLEGLFADISDCRTKKYQFNHLTVMELLSAIHISRRKDRMEIIEHNLKTEFYQVVMFSCQLIGGYKYDGIIKDMFGNDEELKAIDVEQFLPRVLDLVGQCINYELKGYEQLQQLRYLFKLSIDIIMCFINKDVSNKNFIISTVKTLRYKMDSLGKGSMRKVSELCDHLNSAFNCNEEDLKETFENVLVDWVHVDDVKSLTCVKYLPNVERIILDGMKIKINSFRIRSEANAVAKWKGVTILNCEYADDGIIGSNMAINDHQLNRLGISECTLNKYSFINLCNWALASSVNTFKLYGIDNIEHSWWGELVDASQNAKEKKNGILALRKLEIDGCTQKMSKEMQMKDTSSTLNSSLSESSSPEPLDDAECDPQSYDHRPQLSPPDVGKTDEKVLEDDYADGTQTPYRTEVKFISKDGATMELYITGIKLEVPKNAFTDETLVELSILEPSDSPKFKVEFGEAVLSRIIRVGPASMKFNRPAILSIPYSIVDIPKYSTICINRFVEDTKQWVRLAQVPGPDGVKNCLGSVDSPGLYVLCHLLDISSHSISHFPTSIRPFGNEAGIEIAFKEKTFIEERTTVDFKVNIFNEMMCQNFETAGIKPIIILHVNVRDNAQPVKPVKISLPVPVDVVENDDIMILHNDNGGDFKDVTQHISFNWSKHHVHLNVLHFTKYGLSVQTRPEPNVENIEELLSGMYEVYICLYENKANGWHIRIGCCEDHEQSVMDNEMDIEMFTVVGFFKTKMSDSTKLSTELIGHYKFADCGNMQPIIFKANTLKYTDPLNLEPTESTDCRTDVRFYIDGKETHHVISLEGCQTSSPPASTALEAPMDYSEVERKQEALPIASKEPALSELKDDHNFVQELDADLDHPLPGNIRDLTLRFPLSYKERCIVLNSRLPSRAFFTNLLKRKIEVAIGDLLNDLKTFAFPNKIIFKKINEDIKNRSVSFSLESKLGDFKDSQKILYILENIADNLVPEERTLLPNWKNVASNHGYSSINIISFCNVTQSPVNKTERLLSLICTKEPILAISNFIEKLVLIGRNDIVGKVHVWCDNKVGAGKEEDDAVEAVVEEPTISSINDYNIIQRLAGKLESSSESIKQLWELCQLPTELSCDIITFGPPCHAFFENLSVGNPELTLDDLRETIEKKLHFTNNSIFQKVDRDIEARSALCSLDVQLGDVLDDSEKWLYLLKEIANKLLPQFPAQLPSWKNVASCYNYKPADIERFQCPHKGEECSAVRILSFIFRYHSSRPLSDFTSMLEVIGRKDVVDMVNDWLELTMEPAATSTSRPGPSTASPQLPTARPQSSARKRSSIPIHTIEDKAHSSPKGDTLLHSQAIATNNPLSSSESTLYNPESAASVPHLHPTVAIPIRLEHSIPGASSTSHRSEVAPPGDLTLLTSDGSHHPELADDVHHWVVIDVCNRDNGNISCSTYRGDDKKGHSPHHCMLL